MSHNNTLFIKYLLLLKGILHRLHLVLKGEKSYDLTLFSAEDEGRTELPTERKKRRAREEEGRVINSAEINQTVVLAITIAVMALLVSYYSITLQRFTIEMFGRISTAETTMEIVNMPSLFASVIMLLIQTAGIVLIVALVVGLAANLAQTKFLFTMNKLKIDLKKIAPTWKNFKERAFLSSQNMMNLVKILFKMLIITIITYTTIRSKYELILSMINMSINNALLTFFYILIEMIYSVIAFLIIISAIDYFFQKKQYIESLKMTKFEMKQEYKEMEGDPLVKSKLQEMARSIVTRTMLKSVPEADVVITNPTHFAVAIKYDNGSMYAPIVTAKGADNIAFKIRELAKANNVEIVENKPLARELFYNVEIGKYIPERLFFVVSRILSTIYQMKRNKTQRKII